MNLGYFQLQFLWFRDFVVTPFQFEFQRAVLLYNYLYHLGRWPYFANRCFNFLASFRLRPWKIQIERSIKQFKNDLENGIRMNAKLNFHTEEMWRVDHSYRDQTFQSLTNRAVILRAWAFLLDRAVCVYFSMAKASMYTRVAACLQIRRNSAFLCRCRASSSPNCYRCSIFYRTRGLLLLSRDVSVPDCVCRMI